MPKAKKESVIEEIKEKAESVVKEVVNEVEELIEDTESALTSKKKSSKSESKDSKEDKLAKLREKAKALEGKVKEADSSDLKKKVKSSKESEATEKEDALVPIEDYLKSSIHLGTRVITPDMKPFVYKRRADGLAVFNTALLDDKIREGAEYLSQFAPEDVIFVCKREAGWKAAQLFSKITGIRTFTKKYPAGILTNPKLDNFIETELVFVCDPWLDKNALSDALNIKVPVLSISDTNNYTQGINKIIPGNNKSSKSLGMILYLLAKLYTEKRKIKTESFSIEDFIDNWSSLVPPK